MRLPLSQHLSDVTIKRCLTLLICAATVVSPLAAEAQIPAPSDLETRATTPAYEASRQAFGALAESDRRAIQEALVWVGTYSSTIGGVFGARTYDGIVAYQQRINEPADGVLSAGALAGLKAAGAKARTAIGFEIIRDSKTGIDIGVPLRLLPKQNVTANGGSRWQSANDKITMDTRRIAPEETDVQSYYQRVLATQSPGRKVTYKIIRPDFFVITGETPTGKFYSRYASGPDGLRGFSLGYDKSVATTFDRIAIAISNSFTPFPDTPARVASGVESSPSKDITRLPASMKGSTGVRIGTRQVVAFAPGCAQPKVDGNAANVVKQDAGMVLLEVGSGIASAVLNARTGPLPAGASIVVVTWNATGGSVITTGLAEENSRFSAPLQAGATGGLIFDRTGAVAGLVGAAVTPPRSISGVLTPTSYAITPVSDVQSFVGEDGLFKAAAADGPALSAGEIAASVSGRIASVACGD